MSRRLLMVAGVGIAALLTGLGFGWLAFSPVMTNAALVDELAKANVILTRHEKQAANRAAAREREEADRQKNDKPLDTSIDTNVKLITETYSASPLDDVTDDIHNLDLKAGVRVQFRGTPQAVRSITVAIDENSQLGIQIASAISDEITNNASDVKRFIATAAFPVRNIYSEVMFGDWINVRIDHDGGAIEFFSNGPTANRFGELHRLPDTTSPSRAASRSRS